ncbi:MAG: DUF4920 domain-containing protein [Bacteroidales bacterium]|nr:DUF4920 domain-containing protein [Bacteroidales bacterium]MCF8349545.1 DUF4920 domain-containing protein [Bacteroidales bacterium]MCF8375104.1 DUF4920 domain-containing protein [Bacteroidales bacterium]MCF8400011.1 DUF4920 domain-containing protein [Bacteroidales bacterium]
MKIVFVLILLAAAVNACNNNQDQKKEQDDGQNLTQADKPEGSHGQVITMKNAQNASDLISLMDGRDSVRLKLRGTIAACCQSSGCWMDIKIANNEVMKVTFKDYAFFIPKDSKGKTACVEGFAKRELIPMETLRHYAMDEGKSKEEIEAITEAQYAYTFEASGVLIREE